MPFYSSTFSLATSSSTGSVLKRVLFDRRALAGLDLTLTLLLLLDLSRGCGGGWRWERGDRGGEDTPRFRR